MTPDQIESITLQAIIDAGRLRAGDTVRCPYSTVPEAELWRHEFDLAIAESKVNLSNNAELRGRPLADGPA